MSDDLDIIIRLKGAREAAGDARKVRAEVVRLGDATEKTGRKSRRMGRGFVYARKGLGPLRAGVTGLVGALGFGAGVGLIGALGKMVSEAREARFAGRATGAALKATGASAWISRKQIEGHANTLSDLSAVDDEVIQKSENLLLTFRQVQNRAGKGNKIFNRATKDSLNLAAGMEAAGKSMTPTDAALQLGKALNDPVKGMTRLTRVGITFTKQQTKQVAAFTKAGDTAKAQGVILGEVEKEFGGQARSQADPLKRIGVIFNNLAETLGKGLLPTLDKGATKFGAWGRDIDQIIGDKNYKTADKLRQILTRTFGLETSDKIESVVRDVRDFGKDLLPVVKAFGTAGRQVLKFAAAHPGLVKVAGALFLANKALRLMRFGSAISGAKTLLSLLLRVGTTTRGLPTQVGGGKWAAAGKAAGALYVASFIAQMTGIEDADPLLFLHPPGAGDPTPGHGDVPGPRTGTAGPDHGFRGLPPGRFQATPHLSPHLHPRSQRRTGHAPRHDITGKAVADEATIIHNVVKIGDSTVYESWDRYSRKKGNRR